MTTTNITFLMTNTKYCQKNGYTAVFEEILDHKNIKVDLSVRFSRSMEKILIISLMLCQ